MLRPSRPDGESGVDGDEPTPSHTNILVDHKASTSLEELKLPKLLNNIWPSEIQARFVSDIQAAKIRHDTLSIPVQSFENLFPQDMMDEVPREPEDFALRRTHKEIGPEHLVHELLLQPRSTTDRNSSGRPDIDNKSQQSRSQDSPIRPLHPKPEIRLPAVHRGSLSEDDPPRDTSTPSSRDQKGQSISLLRSSVHVPCRNYEIDVIPSIKDIFETDRQQVDHRGCNINYQETRSCYAKPLHTQHSPGTIRHFKSVGLKDSILEPAQEERRKILKTRTRSESVHSGQRKRVSFSTEALIRFIPKVKLQPLGHPSKHRHPDGFASEW